MKIKLTFLGLISILLFGVSCTSGQNSSDRLSTIVEPYRFNLAGWEFQNLFSGAGNSAVAIVDDESGLVLRYFSVAQQVNNLKSQVEAPRTGDGNSIVPLKAELATLQEQGAVLKGEVENILRRQITEVLREEGIFHPLDKYIKLQINFPPLHFKLETPPNVLIISPRDRIERIDSILLKQDTSLEEMEQIEAQVDGNDNVSSLVTPVGGMATYPSFVVGDYGLQFAINAIIEEWVHQYLTFKPLGFLYLLDTTGIARNYEAATIDETVAGIVSKEIGALVYKKYYPSQVISDGQTANPEYESFCATMRETRKTVDEYLAQGEIDKAEQYMETQRQYLVSKGYNIRKLNQAYFAFYGTYADSATSIDPIGSELKELRSKSASLKDFLDTASGITSRQSLQATLGSFK